MLPAQLAQSRRPAMLHVAAHAVLGYSRHASWIRTRVQLHARMESVRCHTNGPTGTGDARHLGVMAFSSACACACFVVNGAARVCSVLLFMIC